MKQLIETIEMLRSRNIGFRSLTEAIDTTTAQGVLVFHMFSALAEFERALIRERTRRTGRIGTGVQWRDDGWTAALRSSFCRDFVNDRKEYVLDGR
jgi:hypothetical protein